MSTHFEHVSLDKTARIFPDGRCISYDLDFPGGAKKAIGVIFPPSTTLSADKPEVMEIIHGHCRVRIGDGKEWQHYEAGLRFRVPGNTSFEIETSEPVHYVCHFLND